MFPFQITLTARNSVQFEGGTEAAFLKILAEQIMELEGRVWAGTLGFVKVGVAFYSDDNE